MGIFDRFRKKIPSSNYHKTDCVDFDFQGPTFLDGYTIPIDTTEKLEKFEWREQLQSPTGGKWFRLFYHGDVHNSFPELITGTPSYPLLIIAVDVETKTAILLFDGCKHGYDAMFCDLYTPEQISERKAAKLYQDQHGNEVFKIIISTFNQLSKEEFLDMVEENGDIKLLDGSTISATAAWRNCFDTLQIFAINETGERIEVVSEELA